MKHKKPEMTKNSHYSLRAQSSILKALALLAILSNAIILQTCQASFINNHGESRSTRLFELSASPKKIRKSSQVNSKIIRNEEEKKAGDLAVESSSVTRGQQVFREYNPYIHHLTQKALSETFGFSKLTEIQDKAIKVDLDIDILGRAPTGTGKTIAFIIPTLETILQKKNRPGVNIGAIILSPTRELAIQIGAQTEDIFSHHKDFNVQVMVGGTSIQRDRALLSQCIPTVIVSTPGRFLEHIESSKRVTNGKRFTDIVSRIEVLVLDEADRLLEQGGSASAAIGGGFRKDILRIVSYLPKRRRTLMFSATLPPTTIKRNAMVADLMRDGYTMIDCEAIHSSDSRKLISSQQPTEKLISLVNNPIEQQYLVLPHNMDKHLQAVLHVIHFATATKLGDYDRNSAKIIVFFPTARMVSFYANAYEFIYCKNRNDVEVFQLHSKKSQGYRSRVSSAFRGENCANDDNTTKILFTTDVSARGMDYPMVSHVIQIGVATGGYKGYVHRLGRTGRLSQHLLDVSGMQRCKGWVVLMDFEQKYLDSLLSSNKNGTSNQLKLHSNLQEYMNDHNSMGSCDIKRIEQLFMRIRSGDSTFTPLAQYSYQSFLAYYTSKAISRHLTFKNVRETVKLANIYATQGLGLKEVPILDAVVAKKMTLDKIPEIRIE